MTLDEAKQSGKPFRRKSSPNTWLKKYPGTICTTAKYGYLERLNKNKGDDLYFLTEHDIKATDWEIMT